MSAIIDGAIKMNDVIIRTAIESDLPSINEIYNYYVLNSTCTYQLEPETEQARRAWFAAHGPAHPVTVAELNGHVIGWGSLSKFRERAGYRNSVEASIYLQHDHLRGGIGRAVMVDLINRAKQLGYHTLLGGASSDQTASIKLQESLGFQQVAHLREVGFKFDRRLDVVYMQLML